MTISPCALTQFGHGDPHGMSPRIQTSVTAVGTPAVWCTLWGPHNSTVPNSLRIWSNPRTQSGDSAFPAPPFATIIAIRHDRRDHQKTTTSMTARGNATNQGQGGGVYCHFNWFPPCAQRVQINSILSAVFLRLSLYFNFSSLGIRGQIVEWAATGD